MIPPGMKNPFVVHKLDDALALPPGDVPELHSHVLDKCREAYGQARDTGSSTGLLVIGDQNLQELEIGGRQPLPLRDDPALKVAGQQLAAISICCLDEAPSSLGRGLGRRSGKRAAVRHLSGRPRAWRRRIAARLHDAAQQAGIPVWCGGMLEAGIGRAHNIALSTLPNFVLPGDVSASKRYWTHDIIAPEVEVSAKGTIAIRDEPGFGYAIDHDFLKSVTVREETIS